MKRALLVVDLVHSFPRMAGLAKYLDRHGWQPIVLAPPLPPGRGSWRDSCGGLLPPTADVRIVGDSGGVIASAARLNDGARRWAHILSRSPRLLCAVHALRDRLVGSWVYPDAHAPWIEAGVTAGLGVCRSERIAAILSSASPVSMHIVASRIRAATGIPWVADFRDLWSRNHNYPYGFIRRLLDERLETRTMAACAGFSSVSLDLCRILCNVYPQRPVALIRNGFDPESAPAAPPPTGLPLRMLYSGNIYVGRQDPLPVLDALAHLIGSGRITRDDVRLDFRGPNHEWLHLAIARRGLEGVVTQREKLPWREALAAQRNAQMFLLLDWEAPRDVGVIPLKSFEYLAAGRPILATGGPAVEDEVDRVLLDTRAGSRCRTVAEIEAALEKAVRALRATGEVPYGGIRERIEAFAYPNMAGRFAALLDEVTGGA